MERRLQLVSLHLLESPKVNKFITRYKGPINPTVENIGWENETVRINSPKTNKNKDDVTVTIGFQGISKEVWLFKIGCYQMCEKWLKDRKGRILKKDDIDHYQKMIVAISETIKLMSEIDEVVDRHGGWPGAFQVSKEENTTFPITAEKPVK